MNKTVRELLIGGSAPSSLLADIGFTVLRVFTGLTMAFAHGWDKLTDADRREGLGGMVEGMGFPGPGIFWAWMVVIAEFFAALLLAAGLFTRLSALMLLINMFVAGVVFHLIQRGDPYADAEMALLFGAVAMAFMLAGSGRISTDALLRRLAR